MRFGQRRGLVRGRILPVRSEDLEEGYFEKGYPEVVMHELMRCMLGYLVLSTDLVHVIHPITCGSDATWGIYVRNPKRTAARAGCMVGIGASQETAD